MIRLNEGNNFGRLKVQRITGGRPSVESPELKEIAGTDSPRLAEAGRHTLLCPYPPWSFDDLKSQLSLHNDFGSETGFDSDLEDGMLKHSPVGCSTPKVALSQASSSTSIENSRYSPTKSLAA